MADKAPQSDLPPHVAGGSDIWDEGPAGAILSIGFFAQATPMPIYLGASGQAGIYLAARSISETYLGAKSLF